MDDHDLGVFAAGCEVGVQHERESVKAFLSRSCAEVTCVYGLSDLSEQLEPGEYDRLLGEAKGMVCVRCDSFEVVLDELRGWWADESG